jgi:hypothetical protein
MLPTGIKLFNNVTSTELEKWKKLKRKPPMYYPSIYLKGPRKTIRASVLSEIQIGYVTHINQT